METNATKVRQATRSGIRSLFHPSALSIRLRLIACFILIVLLMIAADAVAVWQYRQIEGSAQRVSNVHQISDAVVRVHLDVYSFRDRMAALASSHDSRQFSGEAASIRQTFLQHVDRAEQMLRATPDIEQDAPISGTLESLRGALPSQLDTAVQLAVAGEWDAVQLRLAIQIPALIELSSSLVERVDEEAQQQRTRAIEDAQKARQRLFIIVPIAALLTLLAAAALGWYITRTVTGPLSVLTACAEALARSDFQHRVHLRGNNEMAVLGNAFNDAAQQLGKLYEDLRRSERELRDVIETIPTFAWTALPDGSVDFVNRHWQEYTGLSADKTTGAGWQDAVHVRDVERHIEKWHASLATGDLFENEVRFRRAADAEYRWFLTRAVPLRDEDGRIVKWYGISTDIEGRKRAEQEREQLHADLAHVSRVSTMGELAASIAHEVNQPLSGVVVNATACLNWLAANPPNLVEVREAVQRIVRDGQRAGDVIARIRAMATKRTTEKERVDLNETIHETVVLVQGLVRRNKVALQMDLSENLPLVLGDRIQLQQVVLNLVVNGIDAMAKVASEQRELVIGSQVSPDGTVEVVVRDSGAGLDTESTQKIFEAFYTTKPGGMGMGLSISRTIIRNHGGRLWATRNDGPGVTLHFTVQKDQ